MFLSCKGNRPTASWCDCNWLIGTLLLPHLSLSATFTLAIPIVQQGEGGHWELSLARTLTLRLWRTPRDTLHWWTLGHSGWCGSHTARMNSGKRTLALGSLSFVLARLQSGTVLLFGEESVSERCPKLYFYTFCTAFHDHFSSRVWCWVGSWQSDGSGQLSRHCHREKAETPPHSPRLDIFKSLPFLFAAFLLFLFKTVFLPLDFLTFSNFPTISPILQALKIL